MGADELVLAGEFPAAERDQWRSAVAAALDRTGALTPDAALARLRSTTYDGITIEPLYTAADAPTLAPPVGGRPSGDGWDVRQLVEAAAGPGRAVGELERGATSILLDLTGIDPIDADALAAVLDGVLLDVAPIVLSAGSRWPSRRRRPRDAVRTGRSRRRRGRRVLRCRSRRERRRSRSSMPSPSGSPDSAAIDPACAS